MSATAAVAALFDTVAPTYETVGPPFFDHFGALLVEHAGVGPGERVLDLAAGTGAVSLPALAMTGSTGTLLAVDLAAGMVSRLGARLVNSGHTRAEAVVGDVTDVPRLGVADASVDVVLCGFALFFLPDPPAALAAWRRALAPGGRLAVSTWGREDEVFGLLRDEVGRLGVDSRPGGEAYDDAGTLRLALRQAGLTDVRVVTVSLDLVLADVTELLSWGRTHGVRGWLDQLDEGQHAQLVSALTRRWPREVPMTWQAHLAVGTLDG